MTADAPPRIRPGWVWAIFLLYLFGFVSFLALQAMRAVPWLPVNAALEGSLGRLTPFDWGMAWIGNFLSMTAATLLFFLRRTAVWAFLVSILVGGVNTVRVLVTRGMAEPLTTMGGFGIVMLCLSLVTSLLISVAILAYVVSLYRRGVLS
ncbi:MAG TPA: hypothetical protein VJV75_01445 [Candidatus Polarisedimenticolia bacterium]|nr:hypothetical protein [Candidatus Polarisedimenticolia bacterium]